ncbi:MAG: alkanesulfonate monooxygenase, partial [Rhizobiales bacterium]|nr:alkanesulfonate monooxygenase [Hyphomicrobiales bacterium]
GYPHLEEAYRFAELVFPLLSVRQSGSQSLRLNTGPFGETIANESRPVDVRALAGASQS